jgi:hypothetical protein
MAGKDKPHGEDRKKAEMPDDERRALKKAKRREKKHTLKVLRRKASRTGHTTPRPDA